MANLVIVLVCAAQGLRPIENDTDTIREGLQDHAELKSKGGSRCIIALASPSRDRAPVADREAQFPNCVAETRAEADLEKHAHTSGSGGERD